MKNRLTIRGRKLFIQLSAIIVFFSGIQVSSLPKNLNLNDSVTIIRLLLIVVAVTLYFLNHKSIESKDIFIPVSLWMFLIILSTYMSGNQISVAIKTLSIPYSFFVYLHLNRKNIYWVLSVWTKLLALLVIIDAITMVIYPNGMYYDGLYSLNWFLGYKTSRFQVELPLCALTASMSYIKKRKIGIETYIYLLLSCFCLFKAEAIAALTSILALTVVFLIIDFSQYFKNGIKGIYHLLQSKNILAFFAVSQIGIISIQHLPFVQTVITFIFNKDATLTTRTFIWDTLLLKILQRPLIGYGYLDQIVYTNITLNRFATSAHNMLIAVLMSGGIIGLIMYLFILYRALERKMYSTYHMFDLPIIAAITICIFIGMTSDVMLFCEFSLVFIELLCAYKSGYGIYKK